MLEYVLYALVCFIIYTNYNHITFVSTVIKHFILKPICLKFYMKIKNLFTKACSLKKLDKNLYEITYLIGETNYKLLTSRKRGPKRIMLALDENSTDVTDLIESYAGPLENFHGQEYTPKDLRILKLHILCQDQEFEFNEDDKINLNVN